MNLQSISLESFLAIDGARRVIVHDHPRQFAMSDLSEPLGYYGLSWRSDLLILQPVIEYSDDRQTLWIGVDQRLVAINLQDGHISLSLALSSHLFQILPMSDCVTILTELEVLLFHNSDCSLKHIEPLPDIGAELSIVDSDLIIRLSNDRRLTLNLQTHTLR